MENGTVNRAVEQVTVAGNFYDLLTRVVCVGNDLRFGLPSSGGAFAMPSVLVDEVDISGE